jgi:O-antigen/teichoic acid export membrane protein
MNKVAKNALVVICSSVLSQLLLFFTTSLIEKRMDVAAFGEVTTVQAMMTYFTLFVAFGLQTYGIREIAKDKNKAKSVVGEIMAFRMLVFFISYTLILFASLCIWKFNHDKVLAILFIIYGLTLVPTALSLDWVYNGMQKMGYNAVYNILKGLIPFVLIFVLLKSKAQLYYVPVFTMLALILGSMYQLYGYFFKEKLTLTLRINKETIVKYISFALPFLISGLLAMINGNVDQLVLSFSRGRTEAGIYGAGYTIIYFIINIVGMIFTPIFPVMIAYFNENAKGKLNELVNKTSKVLAAFIVPVAVGGIILSKQIILLLFKKDVIMAYIPFSILLIYSIILFFRELYGYGLNACNLEKKYVKAVTVSALVNLILNLILTPTYGMNIAAIITLVSEIINFVMMKHYAKELIVVSNMKNIVKVLFPSLLMAAITILLKYFNVYVIINIVISAAAYSAFIFMTKYITISEIKSLLRKG